MKHDQYIDSAPSAQNLVDLVPGWTSKLPAFVPAITGGAVELFADPRMDWALGMIGGVYGKSIIELGPLEAAHTYQLLNAGASHVTAIEANTFCLMKCLIVKELLHLDRASFLLGDFVRWMAEDNRHADIVWASGVLYHMTDPIGLLESLSRVADTLFFWTHYVSDEEMPGGDPRRAQIAETREVSWRGHSLRLYRRPYGGAAASAAFMGGLAPDPMWMERSDILLVLNTLGFGKIDILPGDPTHQQGPNFSLIARRLPAEFDAQIYLQIHKDVADAGIDPVQHYRKYGHKEGRRLR